MFVYLLLIHFYPLLKVLYYEPSNDIFQNNFQIKMRQIKLNTLHFNHLKKFPMSVKFFSCKNFTNFYSFHEESKTLKNLSTVTHFKKSLPKSFHVFKLRGC